MKEEFIQAIFDMKKILIIFHSNEDNKIISRKCAPMDYGPFRRSNDETPRFHAWDYESDKMPHTLSLLPNKIVSIKILNENFDPKDLVKWSVKRSPWFIKRNWGQYS